MKKIIALIFCLMPFAAFTQNASTIISNGIYDIYSPITKAERGGSFAVWFTLQDFSSFEEANQVCNALGVDLFALMKSMKINPVVDSFDYLKGELAYWREMDEKHKERIGEYIEKMNSNVIGLWESFILEQGTAFWIEQTKDPLVVYAAFKGQPVTVKSKEIKNNLIKNPAFKVEGLPFYKKKMKQAPLTISGSRQIQRVQRLDSLAFEWTVSWGNQTRKAQIPAIKKQLPHIHQFYVNRTEVDEGERIGATWDVYGTHQVNLNQGIGLKDSGAQIMFSPTESFDLTLKASNESGEIEKSIHVVVRPTIAVSLEASFYIPESSDGKLSTTRLEIDLYNAFGEIIGTLVAGQGIEFTPKSGGIYYGPFAVEHSRDIHKRELYKGRYEVRAIGERADTIVTVPIIIVKYNDGTKSELMNFGNKVITTEGQNAVIVF